MRACDPPIHYLVGTPKGRRLSKLEAELLGLDWQLAREGVEVKLLSRTGELYVLARSRERMAKERAMRRRQLKKLWARLAELQRMAPARDTLLLDGVATTPRRLHARSSQPACINGMSGR